VGLCKKWFSVSIFFLVFSCSALKIDRVIISADTHQMYVDFWPVVAQAWEELVGVKPTLALIAPQDFYVDESYGDVFRFEPIEGVSTALYAQVIRLLLPIMFPDEVCIITDIDMIPLSRSFYVDSVADISDDAFVVYRSAALPQYKQYAMCYNAAKGSTFGEIFGIQSVEEIPEFIKKFAQEFNHAWSTDQQALYKYLRSWKDFDTRAILLGHGVYVNRTTISRTHWTYDVAKLKMGGYIDAHMLRPYKTYKKYIDLLAKQLGLSDYQ